MLAIKIDNPEIENRFRQYATQHKKTVEDLVSDALKVFLDKHKNDDVLVCHFMPDGVSQMIE